MRTLTIVVLTLCTAMLFGFLSPSAVAGEWNNKTVVTFDNPVEIPGVVLVPGIPAATATLSRYGIAMTCISSLRL
jgi:hypothetical protein